MKIYLPIFRSGGGTSVSPTPQPPVAPDGLPLADTNRTNITKWILWSEEMLTHWKARWSTPATYDYSLTGLTNVLADEKSRIQSYSALVSANSDARFDGFGATDIYDSNGQIRDSIEYDGVEDILSYYNLVETRELVAKCYEALLEDDYSTLAGIWDECWNQAINPNFQMLSDQEGSAANTFDLKRQSINSNYVLNDDFGLNGSSLPYWVQNRYLSDEHMFAMSEKLSMWVYMLLMSQEALGRSLISNKSHPFTAASLDENEQFEWMQEVFYRNSYFLAREVEYSQNRYITNSSTARNILTNNGGSGIDVRNYSVSTSLYPATTYSYKVAGNTNKRIITNHRFYQNSLNASMLVCANIAGWWFNDAYLKRICSVVAEEYLVFGVDANLNPPELYTSNSSNSVSTGLYETSRSINIISHFAYMEALHNRSTTIFDISTSYGLHYTDDVTLEYKEGINRTYLDLVKGLKNYLPSGTKQFYEHTSTIQNSSTLIGWLDPDISDVTPGSILQDGVAYTMFNYYHRDTEIAAMIDRTGLWVSLGYNQKTPTPYNGAGLMPGNESYRVGLNDIYNPFFEFYNLENTVDIYERAGTEDLEYSQYTTAQWAEIKSRYNSGLYADANNPISNLPDSIFNIDNARENTYLSSTISSPFFDPDTQTPDDPATVWDAGGINGMNFVNNNGINATPANAKPLGGTGYFAHNGLAGTFTWDGGSISIPDHPNNGGVWGDGGKESQGAGRVGGRLISYLVEAILVYENESEGTTAYNNAVSRINIIKNFFIQQINVPYTKGDGTSGNGTPIYIPGYIQSLGTCLGTGIRTSQWFTIFLWLRPFLTEQEEIDFLTWLKAWAKFFIDNMIEMYNGRGDFDNLAVTDYASDSAILNKFNNTSNQLDNQPGFYEPYQGFKSNNFGANAFQLFRLTNRELVGITWAGELGYWLKKYKPNDPDADYLWQGAVLRYKLEFLFQVHPYTLNGENSLARIEYQRESDSGGSNAAHYTSFVLHDLTTLAEAEKKYIGTTTLFDYTTRNGQNYLDGSFIMKTASTGNQLDKSLLIFTKEFLKLLQNDSGDVKLNIVGATTGIILSDLDRITNKQRRYALTAIAKMNSYYQDSTLESAYKGELDNLAYPSPSALAGAAVFNMSLGSMGREPLIILAWYAMESILNS